ncbi:hypothetical protein GCM10011348_41110 [Marinobacterium nitratireducens]|uniref:DUF3108 domain-containing protein n=1 Tax=Marinobacterium nitratireducens TaxID=518897 RepID=A0A917ZQQ0_9GAMM|nr:DUF3108 domain-containing protein [Marinobacterium nitratireducens]GGO87582.1 hypothetical protein GCM10011348_41110 [Marinobacterium nitratireducens]
MYRWIRQLLCSSLFVAAGLSHTAQATTELKPFRALYESRLDIGMPLQVDAVRELRQQADGHWLLTSTADAGIAGVTESTRFRVDSNRVVPHTYQYHRKVLGKTRDAILSFDWTNARVTNDVEDKPWHMDIPPGTLDKLAYQIQLRLDLPGGQRKLLYAVADGGTLKEYAFEVLGRETVSTPAGDFSAIKVQRDRGEDADRETYIWFAPELDYMIVKLWQIESDGKEVQLLLKKLEAL